jgi:hypothetical protein
LLAIPDSRAASQRVDQPHAPTNQAGKALGFHEYALVEDCG